MFHQYTFVGGTIKSFGLSIGQLTTPMVKYIPASPLLPDIQLPFDNREKEVLYASVVFVSLAFWILFQTVAMIDITLKPWTTLFGLLIVVVGCIDVIIQKGNYKSQ